MNDNGYHYFIDAHVRKPGLLLDADWLRRTFVVALEGFSVLDFVGHKFDGGGGVTGLFLLAESHCSYHTYPESSYIAIDVFTCGREPGTVVEKLIDLLDCERHVIRYQRRGTCAIPVAVSEDTGAFCKESSNC